MYDKIRMAIRYTIFISNVILTYSYLTKFKHMVLCRSSLPTLVLACPIRGQQNVKTTTKKNLTFFFNLQITIPLCKSLLVSDGVDLEH